MFIHYRGAWARTHSYKVNITLGIVFSDIVIHQSTPKEMCEGYN
jgi:hypothetical protein